MDPGVCLTMIDDSGTIRVGKLSEFFAYLGDKGPFGAGFFLRALISTSAAQPDLFQRIMNSTAAVAPHLIPLKIKEALARESETPPRNGWEACGRWLSQYMTIRDATAIEGIDRILEVLSKVVVTQSLLAQGSTAAQVKAVKKDKTLQIETRAKANHMFSAWTAIAKGGPSGAASAPKRTATPTQRAAPKRAAAPIKSTTAPATKRNPSAATTAGRRPSSSPPPLVSQKPAASTKPAPASAKPVRPKDKPKQATSSLVAPRLPPKKPEVVRASTGFANALRTPTASTATAAKRSTPLRRPSDELKPPPKRPKQQLNTKPIKKAIGISEPGAERPGRPLASSPPKAGSGPPSRSSSTVSMQPPPTQAGPPRKRKKSVRWAAQLVEVKEYELDEQEKSDKQRSFREAINEEHSSERQHAVVLREQHALQPQRAWAEPASLPPTGEPIVLDPSAYEHKRIAMLVKQTLPILSQANTSPAEPTPEDAVPAHDHRPQLIPLDVPLAPGAVPPPEPPIIPTIPDPQAAALAALAAQLLPRAEDLQTAFAAPPLPPPQGMQPYGNPRGGRDPPPRGYQHQQPPPGNQYPPRSSYERRDHNPPVTRDRDGIGARGGHRLPPSQVECHFFKSSQGCRNGDKCKFLHTR
eukprot:m.92072 g.92072  ORF g.92072 m.92072 type:complete len:639 (-) comp14931_c0_seq1:56-1972(-)